MLEDSLVFEQSHTEFDKEPQWPHSWPLNIDLDILLDVDEMEYPGRGHLPPLHLDRTVPPELQSLDAQRRTPHSPIGPVAWSTGFQGPGQYSSPSGPYYGAYRRPSPPDLKTPVDGRYSQSWHGPVDPEGSTIDPMSPRTPGARSEVDFQTGSMWPGVQGSLPYPPVPYMDGKQGPPYAHAGGNGIGDEGGRQYAKGYIQLPPPTATYVYTQHHYSDPHQQTLHPSGHAGSPGTLSPSQIRTPYDSTEDPPSEDEDAMYDDHDDATSEYHPNQSHPAHSQQTNPQARRPHRRPATRARRSRSSHQPINLHKQVPSHNRIQKSARPLLSTKLNTLPLTPSTTLTSSPTTSSTSKPHCPHCNLPFTSLPSLKKHISKSHTRPFSCIFRRYGCDRVFGAKNEWARHIRVQHLYLESWVCDVGKCANNNNASTEREGGGSHSFERKDLFIQHLRRMHSQIFASAGVSAGEVEADERARIETSAQERCHQKHRDYPLGGRCAYCTVQPLPLTSTSNKSGSGSGAVKMEDGAAAAAVAAGETPGQTGFVKDWEAYLEHMAKHLERDASSRFRDGEEDLELKGWLLAEGLLINGRVRGCEGKKGNGRESLGGSGFGVKVKVERGGPVAAAVTGVRKSPRKTKRGKLLEDEEQEGEEDAEFD